MHHTLNIKELQEILLVECFKSKKYDDDYAYLSVLLSDSLCWDRSLTSINHLLSRVLERFESRGINTKQALQHIISRLEYSDFNIQEADKYFIESLFKNDRVEGLALEDDLIIAQNRITK
ncbi:hypothetical protein ULMS_19320 [Patiriisocius marinistellae]|uniref:Uncharacterized protein n=1 Tax=Patiriisocius marinistellae TaxID=2494560 RepID=A0A5J4FZ29_9FLAO|nr:hypothetical protein ULMS_19320 [Patiriisocius marinistellae]